MCLSENLKSCLDRGKFPQELEKANFAPVHKKNVGKKLSSYLLLSMYDKLFERILYNSLFNFLNQKLSVAKSGDSCINQSLSIADEIYHSRDEGYEIRVVFLDY